MRRVSDDEGENNAQDEKSNKNRGKEIVSGRLMKSKFGHRAPA
jgi:hypothetical protein